MASLFWAAVFDILSLVYLLRSLIGISRANSIVRIILVAVLFASGAVTLVLIYILVSRPITRHGVVLWVRMEMVIRLIVSTVVLALWLSEDNIAATGWNQNLLAFVQSIVLTALACIFLFVGMLRNRNKGNKTQRLFQLPASQRVLLISIIVAFIPLMSGAFVFHLFEGWEFSEAWNFVNITALTIGYGDIVPETVGGRVFLIIFGNVMIGCVGVLIGVLQYNLGAKLSSTRWFLVVLIVFWAFGSVMFALIEKWTFLQGMYFTWVTMTTVGYGDLVPTKPLAWEFWFLYVYVMCCMLAFFIGLLSETLKKYLPVNLQGTNGMPPNANANVLNNINNG